AKRGTVERRDDANLARQGGQRPFAGRIEQPFLLETFLELLEGQLPRTEPVRFEVLADELVLALWFVNRDLAPRDDTQAVGGLELQVAQRRAKHQRAQLARRVFQREIQVSGVPDLAVRQLAFDPDLEEPFLEQVAHANRQLGDREDVTNTRGCG